MGESVKRDHHKTVISFCLCAHITNSVRITVKTEPFSDGSRIPLIVIVGLISFELCVVLFYYFIYLFILLTLLFTFLKHSFVYVSRHGLLGDPENICQCNSSCGELKTTATQSPLKVLTHYLFIYIMLHTRFMHMLTDCVRFLKKITMNVAKAPQH